MTRLRTLLGAAAPALLAVALGAPAAHAQTGTIKGRLVWGGETAPAPKPFTNVNKDKEVCAKVPLVDQGLLVDPSTKGVQFGVAYLVAVKGSNPAALAALAKAAPTVVVDQKTCEFIPHVTAVTKEQAVAFTSSDPVGHNVHTQSIVNANVKNQMVPPNGKMSVTFKSDSRPISVKCDIHPWMEGWVMVLDHPFFCVTKPDGSFEIKGVPAGEQHLVVWQEKVGYATEGRNKGMIVNVKADETADVGDVKVDPAKVKS